MRGRGPRPSSGPPWTGSSARRPRRSPRGSRPATPGWADGRGNRSPSLLGIIRVVLKATLLLLAGGETTRMGQPKALLPVGATTLVEWLAARLGGSFAEVLVSANDPQLVPKGLRMVRDRRAGHLGPLAGIAGGLAAATYAVVVAVVCDMPRGR